MYFMTPLQGGAGKGSGSVIVLDCEKGGCPVSGTPAEA